MSPSPEVPFPEPTQPVVSPPARRRSLRVLILCCGLGLAAAAVVLFLYWQPLWQGVLYYYQFVSTKEKIKELLEAAGSWAPFIFMGLQILQVVFAPIPGEATGFLGGFLFGIGPGMI